MTFQQKNKIIISDYKNQWALVTGASSGLGWEFCLQLAQAGMNVVAVARRAERLEELRKKIYDQYGTEVLPVPVDLLQEQAVVTLKNILVEKNIRLRLICNNAGTGRWGRFEDAPVSAYQEMIALNNLALVLVTHNFLADLIKNPTSVIINVSSAACYQPVPYMATYAATKSFVQSFSQALYGELENYGVLVQTLVPGPTATEFDAKAGAYESAVKARATPESVVKKSITALASGRPVVDMSQEALMQRIFAAVFPRAFVIRKVMKMFKPPVKSS